MARRDSVAAESVDEITDALLTASRLLVAMSARSIARVDDSITIPQFRALVLLSSRGPSNVASLATNLNVQPSTATRMVERLVVAGLVDRRPNPESQRELIIELTARGRQVVQQVTVQRRREIAAVVEQMRPSDRTGLVRALTAFAAAGGEPGARPDIDSYQV
ncbi:MarR family transcriptional regulator [Nocardia sp. CDC159]|uniref:MarR family transcriptional regulator n=1 Tax=Nocardia pulmonis TaxID=2951408 RepID=A0A9X2EDR9_9NOCA|nr:MULTISPECIES: MarR family transcriptional regulator [Nocardia]MCM6778967.1 MarR family transcriptional regulator [Nocardia pulmonis]MCM6791856.1 MarR family transcriptional regulator [Nocardia sp. CDC159]